MPIFTWAEKPGSRPRSAALRAGSLDAGCAHVDLGMERPGGSRRSECRMEPRVAAVQATRVQPSRSRASRCSSVVVKPIQCREVVRKGGGVAAFERGDELVEEGHLADLAVQGAAVRARPA